MDFYSIDLLDIYIIYRVSKFIYITCWNFLSVSKFFSFIQRMDMDFYSIDLLDIYIYIYIYNSWRLEILILLFDIDFYSINWSSRYLYIHNFILLRNFNSFIRYWFLFHRLILSIFIHIKLVEIFLASRNFFPLFDERIWIFIPSIDLLEIYTHNSLSFVERI